MSFVNMQGRGFIGTGKGLADDIVQLKQFAIDRKQVSHRFITMVLVILCWHPVASIVIKKHLISSKLSKSVMAVMSFDLASVLVCAITTPLAAAKALTM
ncbi:MAG: hypothetical protein ACI8R8_002168 [Paraglaciecola sp.]|jgi:hypothetical protein